MTWLLSRLLNGVFGPLNRVIPWYRLPRLIGIFNIFGFALRLRERNLHDTEKLTLAEQSSAAEYNTRTADGSFNDLKFPTMGQAGRRFARNVPLQHAYAEDEATLLTPSPRTVSRELLTRDTFVPATTLNLLAAAWIQFQVHDWFNHSNDENNHWQLPLGQGDPWPENPMKIQRTLQDPTHQPGDENRPAMFINNAAHWWDGSQIYGSDKTLTAKLRSGQGGKLTIGGDGLLPVDPTTGIDITGFNENWWIGLSIMHTLFTLEHNAICDRLRSQYPSWSDDELFDRARLVNVAVMAKIHTVEWTPGILSHTTLQLGMRVDWWGLQGEWLHRRFGRITRSELISGIPGSAANHHSGIYAMTEEFVAVYRLHPLLPDDFSFRGVADDGLLQELTLPKVAFEHSRKLLGQMSMADVIYSFGTSHPGAVTLHNFPRSLQQLQPPGGPLVDVAAIDVLRDRERGVPRYSKFLELVHKRPVKTFEELTDNPDWAKQLRDVYQGDIDRVDLMVGLYAERPPPGFGFSDTAFRIFALMAPRRLKSDRFFTDDFTAEVYTQVGMEWIADNNMSKVLVRHYPQLAPSLSKVKNAFAPWPRAK